MCNQAFDSFVCRIKKIRGHTRQKPAWDSGVVGAADSLLTSYKPGVLYDVDVVEVTIPCSSWGGLE